MESFDQCRCLEVHEKARNVLVISLRLSDHKAVTQHRILIKFFLFRSDFLAVFARISYFKFLDLMNLIKQLFHSRLLDMRLVIANSALRGLVGYLPSHIQRALME